MLPQKFTERMQDMLGEEYPAFLESYKEDRIQGLRVNTLKGTAGGFSYEGSVFFGTDPWSQSGFYYDSASQPGKHPYHEAGSIIYRSPARWALLYSWIYNRDSVCWICARLRRKEHPDRGGHEAAESCQQRDTSGQGEDPVGECGADGDCKRSSHK